MDKKELNLILHEGEGYNIKFKESLTNVDKDMVAFVNSSGGRIFMGITDDKEIKGIEITNKLKSRIQDIANNCTPSVKIFLERFKNILIINVGEGDDKLYECSSGFYKRMGPISQKMRRDEIIDFFKSEGKIRFDELTEPKFNYPRDFGKNRFSKFLELAGLSKTTNTKSALTNMGVTERQEGKLYFNNAGVLFLPKSPRDSFHGLFSPLFCSKTKTA
jgi:ATP-dependent DNA helicase RecG